MRRVFRICDAGGLVEAVLCKFNDQAGGVVADGVEVAGGIVVGVVEAAGVEKEHSAGAVIVGAYFGAGDGGTVEEVEDFGLMCQTGDGVGLVLGGEPHSGCAAVAGVDGDFVFHCFVF